jgi:hypothetical protein
LKFRLAGSAAFSPLPAPFFLENSLEKKPPFWYNRYLTKFRRQNSEGRIQDTGDRRRKTKDGEQKPIRRSVGEVGRTEARVSASGG